jgi:hypothetical protein
MKKGFTSEIPHGTVTFIDYELLKLEEWISALFAAAPHVITGLPVEGVYPVRTFGLATREQNERQAIDKLVGHIRERFQRVFGEKPTGRRLWWRERPNLLVDGRFDERRTIRAIWMRFAIEGLTDAEAASLFEVPEAESVTCLEDLK